MNEILWNLFKRTGDVKYYLMAKSIEGEESDNTEDRGNSTE